MQIYKDILTDDVVLSDAFAPTPFAYAGKQIDGVVGVQSRTVEVGGEKVFDVAKGPQGFGYVPVYRTVTDFVSRYKTWGRGVRAALEARGENTAAFSTAATAFLNFATKEFGQIEIYLPSSCSEDTFIVAWQDPATAPGAGPKFLYLRQALVAHAG